MIVSLFRRKRENYNKKIVDEVFATLTDAARQPALYRDMGIPDTPLGRYESLSAHLIVLLHRTRSSSQALEALAQDVLDEFFKDVDHSIRELGVGDAGVPKRMKKLSRMFYGRMGPYWSAMDEEDQAALAEALSRNISPDAPEEFDGQSMATYMFALRDAWRAQDDAELLSGELSAVAADEIGHE